MRAVGSSNVAIGFTDTCDIRLTVTGNGCDKYPAKQHARKVASKLRATAGLIYLVGQPTINLDDSDQPQPFRQRRYFYYLCGADEPDCHLTYDIQNDLLTLYVPDFDLHRAIWMGPTLTVEDARDRFDVDCACYQASLQSDLASWVHRYNRAAPIYALHDTQVPTVPGTGLYVDDRRLLPAMDAARVIKDEYEIRMIRRANEVSGLAHRRVLEKVLSMSNETQIEGSFLDTCVSHGAKNQAYAIIAASGPNAATLHYVKNNESLAGRQLVCLDAGAEWNCYASDVTRTFPLGGDWPSQNARDIYHIVEDMQEQCIKAVRKGVRFRDIQELAHVIAIKGLQRLGVLRNGAVDEIRQSGASSVFFPHGLGHHVGLEVHDVSEQPITAVQRSHRRHHWEFIPAASHPSSALSVPLLEEGMVVTVEPGIYFSELALANARKQPLGQFIDFEEAAKYICVGGVRIEDDILVTGTGYENLTTAPKGAAMLEIIRRGIDK
ncbi:peptidase M24, structural domain-containing protein [Aspergillus taichungensis]|uniref:Xaa-Pro aminopeptidase n=1 Tax=Aspergillus taichungensis TaxID=482145 RepID=A0A2J5I0U5_9EURO|nr:peptidase M24, structural domain-containing protein [Aspergillus taichungensis]